MSDERRPQGAKGPRRRSALYVPAANLRALEKARTLAADMVILDLEDAVAPQEKVHARAHAVAALPGLKPREVLIRINPAGTPWHDGDLAAAARAQPDGVLLPKIASAADIAAARHHIGGVPLWAMIETPAAVLKADEIAAAGVAGLVLGSNDLLAAMGGRHRPDRANLRTAMALTVLAARAHHIAVLDGVNNDIAGDGAFRQDCELARDFGFDGKTLIHPAQIAAANAAFTPSAEEAAYARRVLEAFIDNPGKGVAVLEGRMLEALDAENARRILARAEP